MEGKKKISNVSLFHFSPFEKRKTCCNANTRGCERFLRSIILPRQPIFRSATATAQKSHAHAYTIRRIARIYLAVSFVAYLNINYKRTRLTSPDYPFDDLRRRSIRWSKGNRDLSSRDHNCKGGCKCDRHVSNVTMYNAWLGDHLGRMRVTVCPFCAPTWITIIMRS